MAKATDLSTIMGRTLVGVWVGKPERFARGYPIHNNGMNVSRNVAVKANGWQPAYWGYIAVSMARSQGQHDHVRIR